MDIPNWTNYQIYPDGRVHSKRSALFRKPFLNSSNGYWMVNLRKGKEKRNFYIHRLVAQAYVRNDNPDKFRIVDHLDRNKENNSPDNLRWCDHYTNAHNSGPQHNNTLGEKHIHPSKYNEDGTFQYYRINIIRYGERFVKYFPVRDYKLSDVVVIRDKMLEEIHAKYN
jgi:hypothetical protein